MLVRVLIKEFHHSEFTHYAANVTKNADFLSLVDLFCLMFYLYAKLGFATFHWMTDNTQMEYEDGSDLFEVERPT